MITIHDPQLLPADITIVGGGIPDGLQRVFRSVGVHNPTAAPITLQVWLLAVGGITPFKIINRPVLPNRTDMCPELIGRGLNAGGVLQMQCEGATVGFTSIDTITG
jgi:hypothetical protein